MHIYLFNIIFFTQYSNVICIVILDHKFDFAQKKNVSTMYNERLRFSRL